MAARSRLARMFIPRFGLLWMAAAMLLVVSGAGWWKFHRDLYLEEREVIERALRQGGRVRLDRGGSTVEGEFVGEAIPWDAPLRPPVEFITASEDLPLAARDELLRLPRLRVLWRPSHQWSRLAPGSEIPTAEFLEKIDFALPSLEEPTLDEASLDEPLPDGDDLDEAQTRVVAETLFKAWNAPRPSGERLLIVSRTGIAKETTPEASSNFRVHWLEDRRLFRYEARADDRYPGQEIETIDRDIRRIVNSKTGGWGKFAREFDAEFETYRRVAQRFPHDDYPYHAAAVPSMVDTDRALRDMPRFDLLRAAKIDDVRYRVEFAPFSVPRERDEMDIWGGDPSIDRWTAIVRSDLNWVPEEVDVQATAHFLRLARGSVPRGPVPVVRRVSQRFRKEDDQVFLVERLERYQLGALQAAFVRGLYAVERNPQLDVESLFDPDRFDPEPWPARRELPWLRWYRATFALGCGLAIYLVGRNLLSRRPSADPSRVETSSVDDAQAESVA